MNDPRSQAAAILQAAAVGLHAAALGGAVAVPASAVLAALVSALRADGVAGLTDLMRWGALLGNSALVCVVAVVTSVTLGTALGLVIARTNMPGRRLLHAAALLAACLPVYVVTVVFFSVVPQYELASSALACGWLYGLVYTPLSVLLLAVAFRMADPELEEQALLDASVWVVLLRVTLRQARRGVLVVGTIVALLVATDMTIADLLVVRTFAEEVYTQFSLDNQRVGPVLTGIPVLLVLAALLLGVQARLSTGGEAPPWQAHTTPRVFRLDRWRWGLTLVCALLAWRIIGLPLWALVGHLDGVEQLVQAVQAFREELATTAALATLGATLALLPAVGLAWGAVHLNRVRWLIGLAVIVLLATPAPLVGISLITLFNRPGPLGEIYDSPLIVVMGYFVRFLPVAVLLLVPAVQRVPREIELAARVDGCGWLGAQWHIYWPALRRAAAAVWLVVLILCFGEIGATVLVVPPAWPVLSVRAFTLLHFGVYQDLAVLTLLSAALILIPWAMLLVLLRRMFAAGGASATGRSV